VSKVTAQNGEVVRVNAVDDALAYQSLLASVDKAVFLEREGL
jgi:hypothetical protein